jgi:hypothetical protein
MGGMRDSEEIDFTGDSDEEQMNEVAGKEGTAGESSPGAKNDEMDHIGLAAGFPCVSSRIRRYLCLLEQPKRRSWHWWTSRSR